MRARSHRRRIFELLGASSSHDRFGYRFDLVLITLIVLNVLATILESVPAIGTPFRGFFEGFELFSVAVFSAEYVLRIWCCVEDEDPRFRRPLLGRLRYACSLMALVDLLAVLPFYLAAVLPIDLRFLRVLRLLRILKLSHYFSALDILLEVLRKERNAFGAAFFLLALGTLFASSGIYLVEHEAQPVAFGSIPAAMWWAVATLTTVGYGDVTPVTAAGKVFGASITVMGIGMVALPTGILASGFSEELRRRQQLYDAQMRVALEDGVIDGIERAQLERLRRRLGLSEEEVAGLAGERRRRPLEPRKCPRCGEELE